MRLRRPHSLLVVLATVCALAATPLAGGPSTASAATTPSASAAAQNRSGPLRGGAVAGAAAVAFPCRGYGAFDVQNTPARVQADTFTWQYGTAKVGNGRHDINWKADPYGKPSWRTWFHALYWTGSLIKKSTQGITKNRDPQAIDGAVTIAHDWVRDNPYPWPTGPGPGNATMTRTDHLLCLRGALSSMGKPVPRWLDASLLQHGAWLRKNIWPDHNVGTDQLIAMLGVGCVLDRADLRDDATRQLAARITRVIDAQGANNEQSVGYARWNFELWGAAERALNACGVTTPATRTIAARRAAALGFLAAATTPNGTFAMIGDTQTERFDRSKSPAQMWIATDGAAGAPPAARVAIYAAGYVFGRSGWGSSTRKPSRESFYSLHYGPRRVGHGHNDHTSLTWAVAGRDVLIDPGVGEYVDNAWRDFYTGASAHNQMVTPQMKTSPVTKLVSSVVSAKADAFRFADAPASGTSRVRDVIVLSDPDVVVTFDRMTAKAPTTFTQYWHLPRDQALRVKGSTATAYRAGDATKTTLLALPVGSAKPTAFGAVRGATRPIQGWVWTDPTHRHPAPVATISRSGRSASVATAVVAGPSNASVAVSVKVVGASTRYTFRVGGRTAVVLLGRDGSLRRVG